MECVSAASETFARLTWKPNHSEGGLHTSSVYVVLPLRHNIFSQFLVILPQSGWGTCTDTSKKASRIFTGEYWISSEYPFGLHRFQKSHSQHEQHQQKDCSLGVCLFEDNAMDKRPGGLFSALRPCLQWKTSACVHCVWAFPVSLLACVFDTEHCLETTQSSRPCLLMEITLA